MLHPITRQAVVGLVRSMSSYYSNLIEGHRTTPRDIEAALQRNFSSNPAERALQMQHLAHIEVDEALDQRIPSLASADLCAPKFACWLHAEFYRRLPESLRQVAGADGKVHHVTPGQLRQSEVSVGQHMAPAHAHLKDFLNRFADFYGPRSPPIPLG